MFSLLLLQLPRGLFLLSALLGRYTLHPPFLVLWYLGFLAAAVVGMA